MIFFFHLLACLRRGHLFVFLSPAQLSSLSLNPASSTTSIRLWGSDTLCAFIHATPTNNTTALQHAHVGRLRVSRIRSSPATIFRNSSKCTRSPNNLSLSFCHPRAPIVSSAPRPILVPSWDESVANIHLKQGGSTAPRLSTPTALLCFRSRKTTSSSPALGSYRRTDTASPLSPPSFL